MKLVSIETFMNSQLVRTDYIKENGEILTAYTPTENDIINAVPPQWETFIKDMFRDASYNKIGTHSNTSDRIVTRLETACTVYLSNPNSSPDLIVQFFNELINSLGYTLSVEIINEWNKIAIKNSMDIIFNNYGMIEKI